EDSEDIPKAAQGQLQHHRIIASPPGMRSSPTGGSRYVPSVLVSPSHTQTQTPNPHPYGPSLAFAHSNTNPYGFPRTNSKTPEYTQASRQKQPKPKPTLKHTHVRRPPGKSYSNTNPQTGSSRYVPSVLVSPSHTQTHTRTVISITLS